jgi:myo-inositol-1(or 4)-monophosphatase
MPGRCPRCTASWWAAGKYSKFATDEQAEGAAAPAPAPAPAPRKLTRVRRDAPATGTGPSEGNASFK